MPTRSTLDQLPVSLAGVRLALAAAMATGPVPAIRALGADTATARRVSWLTRMVAVRDAALGAGALVAHRRGSGAAPWLLACAASDAGDAAALAAALRSGRLRGVVPLATVALAGVSAGLGVVAAVRERD